MLRSVGPWNAADDGIPLELPIDRMQGLASSGWLKAARTKQCCRQTCAAVVPTRSAREGRWLAAPPRKTCPAPGRHRRPPRCRLHRSRSKKFRSAARTATRSVSRGASQERRGPTACVGGCAASGELRRADGPWPRRQALAASSVLQAAAGSVGLLAGAPSRRLPDRARSPPCLPVCGPSLSCLESAALLLVNQQPARPSPGQPARSLTTLRHVRPSCRLATSLAAEPATRRRAGLEGRGKDRCCCRSDIRLRLWRMAAALSCLVVAITGRGRAEQEGARTEKKSRGSVGPSFALVRRRPEAPLPPSKSRWAAPCVAVAAQGAALLFCTPPS